MRHRLAIGTGLGNHEQCLMNNKWTNNYALNNKIKEMLSETIDLWFKEIGSVDFNIQSTDGGIRIDFGIEPTYKYDKLKVFTINTDKNKSSYTKGIAFDYYGSGIVSTTKLYSSYKNDCKFKRFVDKC